MARTRTVWAPQKGPQASLVDCPIKEIFYGGARGGGKTDGMLGKNLIKARKYKGRQKGIFFRRELTQLEDVINRAHQIYGPMGWKWHEQKKTYTSPEGALLKFRYLDKDRDAEMYQGHSYTDVYFEELTNFPSPKPVDKMWAVLRSGQGCPTQFHATGNPGGPGHNWVKERYIDPAPAGYSLIPVILPNGATHNRIFIPSKVADNSALMRNDPGYINNLYLSGSEELVRAWLEGDWSVIEGAYFKNWSADMLLEPFQIDQNWTKFRSFDWGSAKPFCAQWWAVTSEDIIRQGRRIPKESMICYRELYGAKSANVGLHKTAHQCGEMIMAAEARGEHMNYSVADPSVFTEDGGPSLQERMNIPYYPADNRRISGWNMVNERMRGETYYRDNGEEYNLPMLYFFNTCVDSIRTVPVLQHDEKNIEDLDTKGEDHCADTLRYACTSRPWHSVKKVDPKTVDRWDKVFNEPEADTWRTL